MDLNQTDWKKNNEEDNESIIIDVRTQEEYNLGHIKKSILIDINQPDLFMESISNLDKNHSYYVLDKSEHYYNLSNGLFDITVEPLSKLWGFYNKEFSLPKKKSIDSIKAYIGFDKIEEQLSLK